MSKIICGIQQIGIGVTNLYPAWKWYMEAFGVDVRVFEDDTVAELMLPYTGNQPQKRHAALALNIEGGGGFEIWQYSGRTPVEAKEKQQVGDLGICVAKIKCYDIEKAHKHLSNLETNSITAITTSPSGQKHFYVEDPRGNTFEVIETRIGWFKKNPTKPTGATYGAVIGVSDVDKALPVYRDILEFDEILADVTGSFDELSGLNGGSGSFRRVVLTHSKPRRGAFSRMLGDAQIELIQALDRTPSKLYEGRYWGDPGFIHLCFDIRRMDELEKECNAKGFPFTVNSNIKHNQKGSFDMGEAAGHFSYIEDPDGTLIEFVETHRVPIAQKYGISLNLDKRDDEKPLPSWMVRMLGLKKVKNLGSTIS
ncbi:MAG: VOC family protein [Bacteroidales bacterium]|nr:VOC family protein [Bacteroidales bacterium]